MSIEQKIDELTAAILKLADAYTSGAVPNAGPKKPDPAPAKGGGKGKGASKPAAEVPPEQEAAQNQQQVPAEPPAAPVTLQDLGSVVMELAKVNRDAAVAILGEYGVAKAGLIPEDKWAEAIGKFQAKLDELKAAA